MRHDLAQVALLAARQRAVGDVAGEDRPESRLHPLELDRLHELAWEPFEDLAFGRANSLLVGGQQLVDDLTAIVLFADESSAKDSGSAASRVALLPSVLRSGATD